MATERTIVNSLPNRPLWKREKEAIEAYERLQMVIPDQYVYDPDADEEIIYGAVFIGWDWVTTVAYDVDDGEHQLSQSDVINAILSVGLDIAFIHEHPFPMFHQFESIERNEDGY